jgi:hypothetical protein
MPLWPNGQHGVNINVQRGSGSSRAPGLARILSSSSDIGGNLARRVVVVGGAATFYKLYVLYMYREAAQLSDMYVCMYIIHTDTCTYI